jgi:hypothetical protein
MPRLRQFQESTAHDESGADDEVPNRDMVSSGAGRFSGHVYLYSKLAENTGPGVVNGRVVTVRLPRHLVFALNATCRRRGRPAAKVVKALLEEHAVRPFPPARAHLDTLSRKRTFRVEPELFGRLQIAARGGGVATLVRRLLAGGLERGAIVHEVRTSRARTGGGVHPNLRAGP